MYCATLSTTTTPISLSFCSTDMWWSRLDGHAEDFVARLEEVELLPTENVMDPRLLINAYPVSIVLQYISSLEKEWPSWVVAETGKWRVLASQYIYMSCEFCWTSALDSPLESFLPHVRLHMRWIYGDRLQCQSNHDVAFNELWWGAMVPWEERGGGPH